MLNRREIDQLVRTFIHSSTYINSTAYLPINTVFSVLKGYTESTFTINCDDKGTWTWSMELPQSPIDNPDDSNQKILLARIEELEKKLQAIKNITPTDKVNNLIIDEEK